MKFADLNTIPEQPQISTSPVQDQPSQTQPTPLPDTVVRPGLSKQDRLAAQRQLLRLKHEHPHRYITFMTRIQPQLNNVEVFIERLRRVQARDPKTGHKIKKMLHKTPVKGQGNSMLGQRIRFLRSKQPQEYIHMMEMLFPEVRPQAMQRHWLRMRKDERGAVTASSIPPPRRQ